MSHILVAIKPKTREQDAAFLFDERSGDLRSYGLKFNEPVTVTVRDKEKRFCQGWYDIEAHQNHPCPSGSTVDPKFDSCYECRTKTDFNPAFYHAGQISAKQADYNAKPHSVYVAYFGNDLYKAGILSDSRGLDRLFEQGALYYAIVAHTPNAQGARALEERLIGQGLRNSVTKAQKQTSYESLFRLDDGRARQALRAKLQDLGFGDDVSMDSILGTVFWDGGPAEEITTIETDTISGVVQGAIGSYLVVSNGDRLFGSWLSRFLGYEVALTESVEPVEAEPLQGSLF